MRSPSDSRNYNLTPPDYRTYEPSFFIQDSWKARPNLTLLYGVRYDVFTPFTEAHSRISDFDFYQAQTLSAANIGQALKVANVNGVDGHAGIKTDYSNFAPRVGFSYSVAQNTVVRGGYGLSYFPGNYTSNADLKNAPFVSVFSPNCLSSSAYNIQIADGIAPTAINANCATISGAPTTFDQGLPLPAAQTINSPSLSFVAEDTKFRSAIIQQFNLQVQQQFGANVLSIGLRRKHRSAPAPNDQRYQRAQARQFDDCGQPGRHLQRTSTQRRSAEPEQRGLAGQ